MTPKRPNRPQSGGGRGPAAPSSDDDSPAQTNLGLLLQRALQAAQVQQTETEPETSQEEEEPAISAHETKLCADCWNAITFKDERGRQLARCSKDLWVRAAFTYDELNNNKIRRWYADCPEFDDSE